MSAWQISRSRSTVTPLPKSRWLIWSFWQKTQSRLHPEKKTVPEPRVPEMGGSSHIWRAALATTGSSGIRQCPLPTVSVRSARHSRGHRLHTIIG